MRRVALVEDSDDHAFLLERCLRTAAPDVEVLRFATAERAIAALEADHGDCAPALVVMDMQLPGIDGAQATQKIKQIGRYRRVPIVVLTSSAMASDKAAAMEAGANAYVMKASDYATLRRRAASLVEFWLDVHLDDSKLV